MHKGFHWHKGHQKKVSLKCTKNNGVARWATVCKSCDTCEVGAWKLGWYPTIVRSLPTVAPIGRLDIKVPACAHALLLSSTLPIGPTEMCNSCNVLNALASPRLELTLWVDEGTRKGGLGVARFLKQNGGADPCQDFLADLTQCSEYLPKWVNGWILKSTSNFEYFTKLFKTFVTLQINTEY